MKHTFMWETTLPDTSKANTEFTYKFDIGIILGF